MQRHVDRTLAADRKGGEALWEKALAVADARAEAARGEWGLYLDATGQNERAAQRLVTIAERGRADARFRDAVISGFLSFSVAHLTAQADDELLARLLEAPTPPNKRVAEALLRNPSPGTGFSPPALPVPTPAAPFIGARLDSANPATLPDFTPDEVAGFARDALATLRIDAATPFVEGIRDARLKAQWREDLDGCRQINNLVYRGNQREAHARAGLLRDEELRRRLLAATEPPPPDAESPDAEIDALIAETGLIEARIAEGCAGPDDLAALARISERADAIGALNLGEHADRLRDEIAADAPAPVADRGIAPGFTGRPPADWEAWRERVSALGGALTLDDRGVATMQLNGAIYAARPLAQWGGLQSSIMIAESAAKRRAGAAPAPAPAPAPDAVAPNPAPTDEFDELAARMRERGLRLDWDGAARVFVVGEPDGEPSRYKEADWDAACRRADYLLRPVAPIAPPVIGRLADIEARIAADSPRSDDLAALAALAPAARAAVAEAPADVRASVERRLSAATAALTPTPAPVAYATNPGTSRPLYDAAEKALAAEFAAASPRLKRMLRLIWAVAQMEIEPVSDDGLWDEWTGLLSDAGDADLLWALDETPGFDALTAELLGAELADDAPDAGDVARWQDQLDALADDLEDTAYERVAHRIGELRRRAKEEG